MESVGMVIPCPRGYWRTMKYLGGIVVCYLYLLEKFTPSNSFQDPFHSNLFA